mgnify:CR=1 FL=1
MAGQPRSAASSSSTEALPLWYRPAISALSRSTTACTSRRRPETDLEVGYELDPPAERVDAATFAGRRLAEELHALLLEHFLLALKPVEQRDERTLDLGPLRPPRHAAVCRPREPVPEIRPFRGLRYSADSIGDLAAVTAPGGWLVAQCGGVGNIASIQRVLATIGDGS